MTVQKTPVGADAFVTGLHWPASRAAAPPAAGHAPAAPDRPVCRPSFVPDPA